MPASKRRDPIVVERLATCTDPATGELAVEQESNWQPYFPCFAEVITKGQREFAKAGVLNADVSHLVRVPWSTETLAITSEMRIILQATGETLKIEDAYRRDASNREIEILCRN